MSFRTWIAGLIAPELIRDSDRYYWLLADIDEKKRWLSEFPIVLTVLDRISIGHRNFFRQIDEKPLVHPAPTGVGCWSSEISKFREQLRGRFPKA